MQLRRGFLLLYFAHSFGKGALDQVTHLEGGFTDYGAYILGKGMVYPSFNSSPKQGEA